MAKLFVVAVLLWGFAFVGTSPAQSQTDGNTPLSKASSFSYDTEQYSGSSGGGEHDLQYAGSALWSGIRDIVTKDRWIFTAGANGIQTFKLTNRNRISPVSQLFLQSRCNALALIDDQHLAVLVKDSVVIVDISNPKKTTPISAIAIPATGISAYGGDLYAANHSELWIYDLSLPDAPRLAGHLDYSDLRGAGATRLRIAGNRVYIASWDLYVIDITDISMPGLLGIFSFSDKQVHATDLEPIDSAIVISCASNVAPATRSSLLVVDAKDPNHIIQLAEYIWFGNAGCLRMKNRRAYITTGAAGVAEFDLSETAAPRLVACYQPQGYTRIALPYSEYVLLGTEAEVMPFIDYGDIDIDLCTQAENDYSSKSHKTERIRGDLQLVDFDAFPKPAMIATYPMCGHFDKITIHDGNAYVIDFTGVSGLRILNISGNGLLSYVGGVASQVRINDIAISKHFAFATGELGLLQVYDIKNPKRPSIIATCDTMIIGYGICAVDEYVYIAAGDRGIVVYDISNKNQPMPIGQCFTHDFADGVVTDGKYLYVPDRYSGLSVIDILDPGNPQLIDISTDSTDDFWGTYIDIYGQTILVAGPTKSRLFDITHPTEPRLLWSVKTPYSLSARYYSGYLILSCDIQGVIIYDMRDAAHPDSQPSYTYNTPGRAFDARLDRNGCLYIADFASVIGLRMPIQRHEQYWHDPGSTGRYGLELVQNWPNPFNGETAITYKTSTEMTVTLKIYNILGEEVVKLFDGFQAAGEHKMRWDGSDRSGNPVSSGFYIIKLNNGEISQTKKMLLLK